jgi:shikimate kinase
MIVYLVGMPGAGKSVVGKELAGRLGELLGRAA